MKQTSRRFAFLRVCKVVGVLLAFVCVVLCMLGYLVLGRMIAAGERQIAAGQRQFEAGQPVLAEGKARLAAGKEKMAEGIKEYDQAKDAFFLVLLDDLFKHGKGFRKAEKQIAAGERRIAAGERRVAAGQRKLDAGELELTEGREKLQLARRLQTACALGAVFFAALMFVIGFFWRRSSRRQAGK